MKTSRLFLNVLFIAALTHGSLASERKEAKDEYYHIYKTAPYYPPSGKSDAKILAAMHQDISEAIAAYQCDDFDYAKILLDASRKNPAALAAFLQHCHQGTMSAAGGEMNDSAFLGLLLRWGDYDFAAVVAKQSRNVRKDLLERFWLEPWRSSALDNFVCIFPLTSRLCRSSLR
jgi:hypothetical protein